MKQSPSPRMTAPTDTAMTEMIRIAVPETSNITPGRKASSANKCKYAHNNCNCNTIALSTCVQFQPILTTYFWFYYTFCDYYISCKSERSASIQLCT